MARSWQSVASVSLTLLASAVALAQTDDSPELAPLGQPVRGSEIDADDLSILHSAQLQTDSKSLLAFFRQKANCSSTTSIQAAIRSLGDPDFTVRQAAAADLQAAGKRAESFLRKALADSDLEVGRRSKQILATIESLPGPALAEAAARVLAARGVPGAIEAILNYLPLVEDAHEEEELLRQLGILVPNEGQLRKAVLAALGDEEPLRRAGAVVLVGKAGGEQVGKLLPPLLKDPDARVRFYAGLALFRTDPNAAMPVLLALLEDGPLRVAWHVQGLLEVVTAQKPSSSGLLATETSRRSARADWDAWWKAHKGQVDFSRPVPDTVRGTTLLANLDAGTIQGCAADFEPRWQLKDLVGPVDCQLLANGHVLVAENHAERLTERDHSGNLVWEAKLHGPPRTCQRLDNGNTFTVIVKTKELLEIDPDGRVYWSQKTDDVPYFARKLRDGRIAVLTWKGPAEHTSTPQLVILSADGKERARHNLLDGPQVRWPSFTVLPSGNYLIAGCSDDRVLEVDRAGTVKWECHVPGAISAARLPNGHTLVALGEQQRLLQLDRDGKIIREKKTEGRPWFVQFAR